MNWNRSKNNTRLNNAYIVRCLHLLRAIVEHVFWQFFNALPSLRHKSTHAQPHLPQHPSLLVHHLSTPTNPHLQGIMDLHHLAIIYFFPASPPFSSEISYSECSLGNPMTKHHSTCRQKATVEEKENLNLSSSSCSRIFRCARGFP